MSKTIDEQEVIRLYVEEKMTLRMIAEKVDSNHHRVKRILLKHGIEVTQAGRKRKEFTQEHRERISASCKGRKVWSEGLKMTEQHCRKNMAAKMGIDFSLEKYTGYSKLKFLTRYLGKHSTEFSTSELKKQFLDKFYFDQQFNNLYDKWQKDGQNKWSRPTLDHKTPISRGGNFALENLQFITWFENRAKAEMTLEEWKQFREDTKTKSELFYE